MRLTTALILYGTCSCSCVAHVCITPGRTALLTRIHLRRRSLYACSTDKEKDLKAALRLPEADPQAAGIPNSLRQELIAMQQRNQRNGAVVLGTLLAVIIWIFTLPPDIRRADVCELNPSSACVDAAALANRIAKHYETCGDGEGITPCVRLDVTVDPAKVEAFSAAVNSIQTLDPEPPE